MPRQMPRKPSRVAKKNGPDFLGAVFLKISEAVRSTENLQDLFATLHRIVGELMPVRNFAIAFYEKDDSGQEYLSFPFWVDERDPRPAGRLPLRQTLTGYVIKKGVPLLLTPKAYHGLKEKGEIDDTYGTDACIWLGVPLKIRDTIIGVVVVQSYDRSDEYGEREKNILTLVSEQIAIAIEMARYRQSQEEMVRQRTRELEEEKKAQSILFDISQAVYSSASLRDFLFTVHQKVGELMDARNFYVALYNKEIDKYSFPYFADEFDRAEDQQPEDLHKSLTDYARRHGALLADGQVHQRLMDHGEVEGVIGTDSLVWLGVPLQVPGKDEAIGVMTVQSYEDSSRYTEKEKRILMNISTTVAFAIDRILLVTDIIHHFNNAITGIKGNAEMLLAASEKQNELTRMIKDRLHGLLPRPVTPELAQNFDSLEEMANLLIAESQSQSGRIGKILQGIDQAADRVTKIFTPILLTGGYPSTRVSR